MEEPGCQKMPPDRELDDCNKVVSAKKSKKEIKEDTIMSDKMEDAEGCFEETQAQDPQQKQKSSPISYRDSLLGCKKQGFNGVANGCSGMEEDTLISDVLDQTWSLPEPSEELKKLMEVYPVMPITEEEFNDECKQWNNALIITVLGARFNLYKLREHLGRIWGFTDFELVDLPNNYYVVRFNNDESWGGKYKRVLFEGPWAVAQHSILVQKWSPYFDPFHNPLGRIATWVRIPNIPLHCYSKKFIWRIGDMIGRTLRVDMNTIANLEESRAKVERGRFARICVEVDLQKKLIPRIICTSALFNVEYEGLNLICFECGRYGHTRDACPWKPSSQKVPETAPKTSDQPRMSPAKTLPEEDEHFGPWMLVKGNKS
ncbi:uncharacterized protein LOC114745620 [Neltuma alba]|uniref:uncharacterized protein LOC114745620 n=1 Tax=Neltuma alba TaxID=207710 RepID=UPI0010A5979D|nr:uncharacterized protein LOC114745620 [Prosopis alba]